MSHQKLPIVAIVGRPNVGKSALFNAIVGRRISIVHEECGVTRDRVVSPILQNGRGVTLVDTGGLGVLPKEKNVEMFDGLIRDQVQAVIADAAMLIWVVDAQDGLTALDKEICDFLRGTRVPLILVANKADSEKIREQCALDFAPLGMEEIIFTSCTHNYGIWDVREHCLETVGEPAESSTDDVFRLAVVGRPNVGKSSLINSLLNESRVVVSEIAGTTRDAVDIPFSFTVGEQEISASLIDTAGLRRRSRLDTVVEYFSIMRTENAIKRADMIIFVLDSTDPGTAQDRRIARLICEANKPCLLVANKWDLIGENMRRDDFVNLVRGFLPFMAYSPLAVLSAMKRSNLDELFVNLALVYRSMHVKVPTALLNQFLHDAIMRFPPPSVNNRFFKLYYATMKDIIPPEFLLFVNDPKLCPDNYRSFLENQLRKAFFGEAGIPLRLNMRRRTQKNPGVRAAAAGEHRKKQNSKRDQKRRVSRSKGHRK